MFQGLTIYGLSLSIHHHNGHLRQRWVFDTTHSLRLKATVISAQLRQNEPHKKITAGMEIKVYRTLHLFAAQHVCSWGAEGKRAFAVCSNSRQLCAESEDVFLQVRSWVFFFFFFNCSQRQNKQRKMLTASCLNVPEGSGAKQARMSAHIFEDSNPCLRTTPCMFFLRLRDSLVLTYTDVASPNILSFNQQASRPLSPTGVDYGLADLLKVPRCQSL